MASDTQGHKQLVSLLLRHREAIFGFIYTLVHHRADAEDILQDASLIMWEKFDEFDVGTDFIAWANQIAYFCVKNAQRKQSHSRLVFDEELLETLSATANEVAAELEEQNAMLVECLQELPDRDRSMIAARYGPDGSVALAAEVASRSTVATYKALGRVRKLLADCVNRKRTAT